MQQIKRTKPKTYRSPDASIFYSVGIVLLAFVVLTFIVSLFATPYSPDATDAASKLLAPCPAHPFGTDNFGRDVLSRVMSASKYTIFISVAGVAISLILGTVSGIPAGYFGGLHQGLVHVRVEFRAGRVDNVRESLKKDESRKKGVSR